MTTEQTLSKRINWSAVMTAIGAGVSTLMGIIHGTDAGLSGVQWETAIPLIFAAVVAAYKGTARGSLAKKPKPATLDSADPVGKGG